MKKTHKKDREFDDKRKENGKWQSLNNKFAPKHTQRNWQLQ